MAKTDARPRLADEARAQEAEPLVSIVHRDAATREALEWLFASVGIRSELFSCPVRFSRAERPDVPSCIILDVRLPGASGLDLQEHLALRGEDRPFVFITRHGDVPVAVRAMKAGATDFLTYPWRDQEVLDAVAAAIEQDRRRRCARRLRNEMQRRFGALTVRERQVMAGVVSGLMNKQVAHELAISEVTVKCHRASLMRKLGTRSLAELVRVSLWFDPDGRDVDPRFDAMTEGLHDPSNAGVARDRLAGTAIAKALRDGPRPSGREVAARL